MQEITLSINQTKEYQELYKALQAGRTPALACGLSPIHKAQLAAVLRMETPRPVLLLTDDEAATARLAADLSAFSGLENVLAVPPRELMFLGVESHSHTYEQARISALHRLHQGVPLAVASVAAAQQAAIPPDVLQKSSVSLQAGDNVPPDGLVRALVAAGYQRTMQVEGPGQFSSNTGATTSIPCASST